MTVDDEHNTGEGDAGLKKNLMFNLHNIDAVCHPDMAKTGKDDEDLNEGKYISSYSLTFKINII
jgi:hypothetical protein